MMSYRTTIGLAVISLALALQILLGGVGVRAQQPPPQEGPTPPRDLLAIAISDASSIGLQWQDNADNERFFQVERSGAGEAGPWAILATLPADTEEYVDNSSVGGETYWYRVGAENASGLAYSNVASAEAGTGILGTPVVGTTPTPERTVVLPDTGTGGSGASSFALAIVVAAAGAVTTAGAFAVVLVLRKRPA